MSLKHSYLQLGILIFSTFNAFSAAEFGKKDCFLAIFRQFLASEKNKLYRSFKLMLVKDLDYILGIIYKKTFVQSM